MTIRSWRWALLMILVATGGCSETDNPFGTLTTAMTMATPRTSVLVGTQVHLTVEASSQRYPLVLARIDFEDDGTWDETLDNGSPSLSTTFSHTYTTTGTVTARAEVIDANDHSTVRTIELTMIDPGPSVDLAYKVSGWCANGMATAYASGPPAACADCSTRISLSGTTGTIGTVLRGENVDVSQTFVQQSTFQDGCAFGLTLLVEANGVALAEIGGASCSTSTRGQLSCTATVSGIVP